MIDLICAVCHKGFLVQPSALKYKNPQYCSRACYAEFQRAHDMPGRWKKGRASFTKGSRALSQRTLPARFWAKVTKQSGHFALVKGKMSECWEWAGSKDIRGYGRIQLNNRPILATHAVFLIIGKPILPGEQANHHCDNPSCVRQYHLYRGDQKTNMQDSINRGRHSSPPIQYGRSNHRTRLTPIQVRAIRELANQGVAKRQLARQFRIARTAIKGVLMGETHSAVL